MYQPSVPVKGLAFAGAGRDRRDGEVVAEGLGKSAVCQGPSMIAFSLPVWKSCLRALPSVLNVAPGGLEVLEELERLGEAALVGDALAGVVHEGPAEGAREPEHVVDALVHADLDAAVRDAGEQLIRRGRRRGDLATCRTTGPRP